MTALLIRPAGESEAVVTLGDGDEPPVGLEQADIPFDELHLVPSDRCDWSPDSWHGVGVDTITVVGPATDALLNELRFQHITRVDNLETGERLDRRAGAFGKLKVCLGSARVTGKRTSAGSTVAIEFSAPTLLLGQNRDPLDVAYLMDVVALALWDLGDRLPDLPQLAKLELQRLDLVRDFHGLRSPTATLNALSRRVVAHAQDQVNFLRSDGGVQTIWRGSKRYYLVRGYDKHHELIRQATRARNANRKGFLTAWAEVSPGQFRFEAQLRRPDLRKVGLVTLTDCTPDRLDEVAQVYFERVGWSTPYGGSRVADTLTALSRDLSAAKYRNLLAFLHSQKLGIPSGLSPNTVESVRPIARQHHLLDLDDDRDLSQLDFKMGREVSA